MHVGEYPDGRPGEIFLDAAKQGTFINGILDGVALLTSKCLQFGMPLFELCDSFIGTIFEPSGHVEGDPEITEATSLLDYIGKRLRLDYLTPPPTQPQEPPTQPAPVPTQPIPPYLAGSRSVDVPTPQ